MSWPTDILGGESGPHIDIADLAPQDAIAVFGLPVYQAWLAARAQSPGPALWVVAVDRATGTVTISAERVS